MPVSPANQQSEQRSQSNGDSAPTVSQAHSEFQLLMSMSYLLRGLTPQELAQFAFDQVAFQEAQEAAAQLQQQRRRLEEQEPRDLPNQEELRAQNLQALSHLTIEQLEREFQSDPPVRALDSSRSVREQLDLVQARLRELEPEQQWAINREYLLAVDYPDLLVARQDAFRRRLAGGVLRERLEEQERRLIPTRTGELHRAIRGQLEQASTAEPAEQQNLQPHHVGSEVQGPQGNRPVRDQNHRDPLEARVAAEEEQPRWVRLGELPEQIFIREEWIDRLNVRALMLLRRTRARVVDHGQHGIGEKLRLSYLVNQLERLVLQIATMEWVRERRPGPLSWQETVQDDRSYGEHLDRIQEELDSPPWQDTGEDDRRLEEHLHRIRGELDTPLAAPAHEQIYNETQEHHYEQSPNTTRRGDYGRVHIPSSAQGGYDEITFAAPSTPGMFATTIAERAYAAARPPEGRGGDNGIRFAPVETPDMFHNVSMDTDEDE